MSIKSKVIAAAAAVTLVGGAGALASVSAHAATPSCGNACANIYSKLFGTHKHPAFVVDVKGQVDKAGTAIILYRDSLSDPAEDINAEFSGSTSDFFGAGLVSAATDLHYGSGIGLPGVPAGGNGYPDDPAFELEYAPYGVGTGMCIGLAFTATQGGAVSLQGCGQTSRTVWIVDTLDTTLAGGFVPLINGSSTNFSHPFVLTYPANGYPTDLPRPQLTVTNLTGFTGSFLVPVLGTVDDNQMWSATFGVLNS